MAIFLGSIADDYTGASDLANTLTKNGLRTVQTVGIPDPALALPDVDAVVVSLKIRSVPASDAVAAAASAERWLRQRGAGHVLYKICSTFDSTDAGNIGPVTEALSEAAGGGGVLVTPAFPETGRTVYLGHLFVGGQPLNESPLKDHPLNPMHDANLVRVLTRQSRNAVGLVDLTTIAAGPGAVKARLDSFRTAGVTAVIADAIFERDLETLGEVALETPVSTGASGLGLGLARALVRSGRISSGGATTTDAIRPVGGLSAVVAGSCSKATLHQLDIAERSMPVLRLDPEQLLAGPDEIAAAISWAGDRISAGPVVVAASAAPETVSRLQSLYGREATGHAIETATSIITAELVERGVRRLVVAGGETSGAAVDRLAIPAFLIGPEIAPGVPVLRTVGNAQGDMLLALKSGNFGGEDFFTAALAMMH
ncbi:four-carbon acid sugar kinase family protein (plasmid) [Rhizobium leguminosarum bv. trifolii]|uniref:3-oxo-tetronate kinase n=1 Tax=Rhizobium ruizarguesonis TaxID=2081791 RepID=UPI001031D604|nr:3-oxo-tetronate kinase [Rhizobium ruizarguesonis]QIO47852.1 four-carbon acid sugar kinase family protein [Rhizobium leguminosarum bv. trifolii]TAT76062.1 four-carbon acid sugar kinase family protein [Rhizobium ruizarguesonis]TAY10200.1 four-carbon acid sugar kinase family protein [Rhizobium ruizarguesonis]TBA78684.1 four-carbon acid sugar kinase family protein [Rhizobium ruizarguesonis]TBA99717.1 four-carbon acid sugar kinase family protein [Rhizobium ruizarguesonis]